MTIHEYAEHLLSPVKNVFAGFVQSPMLKAILAALIAFHDSFVSQHLEGFIALFVLVIFDQVSGVLCAIRKKEFSSHRFRHGAIKLVVYVVLISAFHFATEALATDDMRSLDKVIIAWLIVTEVLSIVENFQCSTGLRIPSWMKNALKMPIKEQK